MPSGAPLTVQTVRLTAHASQDMLCVIYRRIAPLPSCPWRINRSCSAVSTTLVRAVMFVPTPCMASVLDTHSCTD